MNPNSFFRGIIDSLKKHRPLPALQSWKVRLSFFRPSDWLVVSVLSIIMGLSAATMLAGVSLALTSKVPAQGGTYIEGVVGSPRFVNPLLSISDADQDLSKLIFSGLLKRNPDGTLVPDLAASYEVSEDKKTYTVLLREDARFHDGQMVTADDIVFTVHEAQNPEIKSTRRADWEGVAVSAESPKTVVFTLAEPYAPFLSNLTLGILPKHLWEGVTSEEFAFTTLNEKPIGSGPYRIASRKENNSGIPTEYRLRAFEGVRKPYIENFVMKFYQNEEELKNALIRKEVDGAHSINPKNLNSNLTLHEAVLGRVYGIFFNQNQNTLFADITVRKALDRAVDKKGLIDSIVDGYASPIDGPLPPDNIENTAPAESGAERRQQAIDILSNAGWKSGENGILEKSSTVKGKKQTTRLSFSLTTGNDPELKATAEKVAEDWKAIGAEVNLQFFEQNDLSVEVIRPRKYDALLFGEVVGREPDLFAFWHSSQRNDPGLNIAMYANTAVDKALSSARTEDDPEARKAGSRAAAKTIQEEFAAIFLYAPHFVYVSEDTVAGIIFGTVATPSDRFDSVDQWYLKTEQVWPIFTQSVETLFKKLSFPNIHL